VVRAGYLWESGSAHSAFKTRWCVVADGKMFCFSSPTVTHSPCSSEILLDKAAVKTSTQYQCGFEIVTNNQEHRFIADTQSNAQEWISILSNQTQVTSENNSIEQAEDMISRAAYLQSKLDEDFVEAEFLKWAYSSTSHEDHK